MTGTQKVILAVFGLAFVVMMYGVIPWRTLGIPADALVVVPGDDRVLPAVLDRDRPHRADEGRVLTETFVDGARDLLGAALIIGIARGITVIMNNGEITDTVPHWAEVALGDVGQAAFSIVMYTPFLPLSFLIPSSSGSATVAMPIMAPLAGFVDVPESLVVTAYQTANGLGEPVHPDLGGRDGPGDRQGSIRPVPAMGVAARDARGAHGDRPAGGAALA